MKIKTIPGFTLALGLLVAGFTACVSEKHEQAKLAAEVKVPRVEAEKIALAKVPGGKVQDAELEKEGGKLIWSFDIATPGSKDITEVAVDAITGAIVSVEKETPADQAKEKQADAGGKEDKQAAGTEVDEKITMDKVPPAVQQAVKAYASESEIKGIEESDVDGTKVIEFDIEKNRKASEVAFRPDGKLFSTEEEVALADLPEAVQKTIAYKSKNAKAGKPEKIVQAGKTSYEIVIEKDGKKTEYGISPAGKVTNREQVGKK